MSTPAYSDFVDAIGEQDARGLEPRAPWRVSDHSQPGGGKEHRASHSGHPLRSVGPFPRHRALVSDAGADGNLSAAISSQTGPYPLFTSLVAELLRI